MLLQKNKYSKYICDSPPLVASSSWSLKAPSTPTPAWRSPSHHSRQTAKTIDEEKAVRTQALEAARNRLAELRQKVDTKEGDSVRLDERIEAVTLAVATKAEECEAKKGEIAAIKASQKVRVVLPATTVSVYIINS